MKKKKDLTFKHSHLAIIGIGCLFPKASNLDAYWANISGGIDAITEVPETHWQAENYCGENSMVPERLCTSRGGFIPTVDFDPLEFGILPNAIEAIDTSQLLSLIVTQQALKDAGYGSDQRTFDRARVSVIMGVTGTLELVIPLGARLSHPIWRKSLKEAGVGDAVIEDVVQRISSSYVPWQENSFPGLLGNVVAGRIANTFDFGGTNCVIDAACASTFSAMHLASLELISGRSDMVITGGIDTFNDVFMFTCFNETQALSPSGNARPFDVKADGTILGEGLGVLVLKRLEDARRDEDRIYAVIRGIGTSSDGKGHAIYAPSPEGQSIALQNAYGLSDITPDTIELVEAHGTGTQAGDTAELNALTDVYRSVKNHGAWCALGSVKSQIGHTKAAAGAAGIIKAAMALHHKVLPPTIKVDQPTKKIESGSTPFYINTQKRPWFTREDHPRRAAVSSFGFGGSNFHCVLEEFNQDKIEIEWDGQVQILCFSDESIDRIKARLLELPANLHWNELRQKAEESRVLFKKDHSYRLVLAIEKHRTDIRKTISNAGTMLDKYPQKKSWNTPEGAYFGAGASAGKLGMVFPGQGSQYVGMFQDLACRFPQMLQIIEEADRTFTNGTDSGSGTRLVDYIYPHPVFTEDAEQKNEKKLRSTQIAQPAIGAVSFGALKVLNAFGVQPDAVAGHSYGELTALCASEKVDTSAFFSLSILRGRLMAEGNGDKGAMLAAQTTLDLAEKMIREEKLDLVIANKNAPKQMVLSGASREIEKAARAFKKINIRNRRLPVSGAFHSSLVAHVSEPFLTALQEVEFSKTKIPVFANKTAAEYPQTQKDARNILAAQLVNPVEFVQEIENMYESGIRTFLEVGPAAKLTGLIKAIMQEREYSTISVDASAGKHSGMFDLASTLAFLAAQGHNVDLTLWDEAKKGKTSLSAKQKPRMTVPLCGANYMNPKKEPSLKSQGNPTPTDSFINSKTQAEPASANTSVSFQSPQRPPASKQMNSAANSSGMVEVLRMTQKNMTRLQQFQEQTTQLHKQFLKGQSSTQHTFQALVEQQQDLIRTAFGTSPQTHAPMPPAFEQETPFASPDLETSSTEKPATHKVSQAPIRNRNIPLTDAPKQTNAHSTPDIDTGRIEKILIKVVAEKTGYPEEMLELDMELDSDLGIDSIKRVEILSDIQEKLPEAPLVKPEHLGTLKTLRQIVAFLSETLEQAPLEPVNPQTGEDADQDFSAQISGALAIPDNGLERKVLSHVNLDKTMVRETFSIPDGARIWITDEDTGLASEIEGQLNLLKYKPEVVSIKDIKNRKMPSDLGGLLILSPSSDAGDDFIKDSFRLLRHAGPALRNAGTNKGAVFLTISRLDGYFGLTSLNGQNNPASGGISGLLKTAFHEWPEVHCKALDLAGNYKNTSNAVSAIIDEMFIDGPLEVGLSNKGRHLLELKSVPVKDASQLNKPPINKEDVVVITGGARGVTAEVAVAISREFKSTLVLLGRSSEPGPEPDWMSSLTDEIEIKKQLFGKVNRKSTPKQIEKQYQAVIANRELLKNIAKIETAGSRVIYCSVDVRDKERVQSVLDEIRKHVGPIKGLIHGAGVISDRLIEDKTDEQFDRVYSTKVGGLRALLRATAQDDLKIMVMFSSTSGRYGRTGQVDYAVANEVLNKYAQQQAKLRPNCRVVSVNWGPWDGGMVNQSLRKIFEQEGIGLINMEAGANYLIKEICSNGDIPPVEVTVMGKLNGKRHHKSVASMTALSVAFERKLNIEDYPFLKAHVMNGRAVLPMAIIIEWMAHGALHGSPGMKFAGFDNLRVLKGLTLEEGENITIRVLAGKAVKNGASRIVQVEFSGVDGNGNENVHARGEIVLAAKFSQADIPNSEIPLSPYKHDEIYNNGRLFHGPAFHGIEKVEGCSEHGIAAFVKAAPLPSAWIKSPLRSTWLADPLIVDSSFQMMILWGFEKNGIGSLPSFVGHYRQFQAAYPKEGARIVAEITSSSEHKAVADINFIDPVKGTLIARMEGYECVIDASLNCAFRSNLLTIQNGDDSVDICKS